MDKAEEAWTAIYPDYPFEYSFLDQDFNSQYEADQKRGQIFTIFSSLTLIIACLGLLGLISFTTEQRTKEVGIRKVNLDAFWSIREASTVRGQGQLIRRGVAMATAASQGFDDILEERHIYIYINETIIQPINSIQFNSIHNNIMK